MNYQTIVDTEQQYGAHNYTPLEGVAIERGEGLWLYDVSGRRYLDCLSAYSAVSQGHCHPRLVKAMTEQAQTLTLCSRAFRNTRFASFLLLLHELTGYDKALPMNSGAEAVETAIKLVRKWAYLKKGVPDGQAEIIVCQNNFHGRTTTLISMSTEPQYRAHFGPHTPGFKVVPFGEAQAIEAAI
nr:aminotransferase class III-fold pyridoxal phosphate-dependent enzyme [Anaerolineae bacterium]